MDHMGNTQTGKLFCLGHGIMGNTGEADHLAACGQGGSGAGYTVFHHKAVGRSEACALCRKQVNIRGGLAVFYIFIGG